MLAVLMRLGLIATVENSSNVGMVRQFSAWPRRLVKVTTVICIVIFSADFVALAPFCYVPSSNMSLVGEGIGLAPVSSSPVYA